MENTVGSQITSITTLETKQIGISTEIKRLQQLLFEQKETLQKINNEYIKQVKDMKEKEFIFKRLEIMLNESYQCMFTSLMQSIVYQLISVNKPLEEKYEMIKMYPYIANNPDAMNDYTFEQFKLDHESISILGDWKK